MSERSDELTRSRDRTGEPPSTEDLLSETDELLSGSPADSPSQSQEDSAATESETTADSTTSSSRLPSRPAGEYFSPKAFLALALVFGGGLLAGSMFIPLAGWLIGLLAVSFLVGTLTTKRRYLEVGLSGLAVGFSNSLLTDTMLLIGGAGMRVLAVSGGLGLLACLLGYYFGRDLRNGLTRDIE